MRVRCDDGSNKHIIDSEHGRIPFYRFAGPPGCFGDHSSLGSLADGYRARRVPPLESRMESHRARDGQPAPSQATSSSRHHRRHLPIRTPAGARPAETWPSHVVRDIPSSAAAPTASSAIGSTMVDVEVDDGLSDTRDLPLNRRYTNPLDESTDLSTVEPNRPVRKFQVRKQALTGELLRATIRIPEQPIDVVRFEQLRLHAPHHYQNSRVAVRNYFSSDREWERVGATWLK